MMNYRRWVVYIALYCAGPVSLARAESYSLTSEAAPAETLRVEVQVDVGGDLKLTEEGKVRALKMSVSGKLVYDEKLLSGEAAANASGREASDTESPAGNLAAMRRSVRRYKTAEAVIKIDQGGVEPMLRADRGLVLAEAGGGRATLCSLAGPLTREELDLIDVPANSLVLNDLLPNRAVEIGDRWQHSDDLMAALLGLDAVGQSNVFSELKEVTGGRAKIEFSGRVFGAVGGVATEIEVKGKYRYDLAQHRVTGVGLLVKEQRSIGHVTTGLDVVAKVQLALAPTKGDDELNEIELDQIPPDARQEMLLLECQSPTKKFSILHERDWHLMSDAGDLLALRYVDRGELVAQCNVSALPDVQPGHEPPLAKFQADLEKSLGDNFGRFLEASESGDSAGHYIYRVVVEGRVSELPIEWHYYLVGDRQGRAAVFAFTVEQELAERLADHDRALISTLTFADRAPEATPTPAPRGKRAAAARGKHQSAAARGAKRR